MTSRTYMIRVMSASYHLVDVVCISKYVGVEGGAGHRQRRSGRHTGRFGFKHSGWERDTEIVGFSFLETACNTAAPI